MAAPSLGVDQAVDISAESDRVVIEMVCEPVYDLDELLDRLTPETFHEEVDFGPPVGNEVW
jgi:antitoxin MazE